MQGCNNQAAYALSRVPKPLGDSSLHQIDGIHEMEFLVISYPYSQWIDDMRQNLENDPWIMEKTQQVLSLNSDSVPISTFKYQVDNGFLKYKNRIVLSPHSIWKDKIFAEHHAFHTTGYEGFMKTYKRIFRCFYWEGMKTFY